MKIFQPIITGSLNVSGSVTAISFTGSLQGTASFASTASFAPDYVLTSATSSMLSPYLLSSTTSSFATTGSNIFVGNQTISGSLTVVTGSNIELQVTNTGVRIGNTTTDSHTVIGNQTITGSLIISSSADPQFVIGNNLLRVSSSGQLGISGSIIPNVHNTYTLGTSTVRFATLFVQGTVNGNTGLFNNINMGSSTPMSIINNASVTVAQWYGPTANLRMQSGSTPAYVDNGYRLQINSLGAVSGGFYITGSTNQQLIRVDAPGSSSILLVSSSGRVSVNGGLTLNGSDIDTAWVSYTPVWTAASSNPSLGNGTATGQYKLIGKTCFVRGNIVMGTTTTFGSGEWYVSMPFTASNADAILMTAQLLDNGTAWYNAVLNGARAGFNFRTAIQFQTSSGVANDVNATSPFTWASSDRFLWNGSYEIA